MKDEDEYLVWSNEHDGWWAPDLSGYVTDLRSAGRYSRTHAIGICKHALPTADHIGRISEIPVRFADLDEVLAGARVPDWLRR